MIPAQRLPPHHGPPCPACRLRRDLCLCPIPRLTTRVRLSLVLHYREIIRASNTGRLAHLALTNSDLTPHGAKVDPQVPPTPAGQRAWVLYPGPEAEALGRALDREGPPERLFVLDGNWRQARRMARRHPAIVGLPQVRLEPGLPELRRARRETVPGNLATLEAVAHALERIEGHGDPERGAAIRARLIQLFREFTDGMLCQRGTIRKREVYRESLTTT